MLENILIIDNRKEEISQLAEQLNKNGISTSFIDDILEKEAKVNPYTNIVILDLYLSEGGNNYEEAISSIQQLSELIKVPYQVLVWTKNVDKYDEFIEEMDSIKEEAENFPIEIKRIESNKSLAKQTSEEINSVISEVVDYAEQFRSQNPNISSFIRFLNLFREESTNIWKLFNDAVDKENRSNKLEEMLGNTMKQLDFSQGYEKSGKGMLHVQSKIIENRLTQEPLDYHSESKSIPEQLKDSLNEYIMIHNLKEDFEDSIQDKPGVIIKSEEDAKKFEISEFADTQKLKKYPYDVTKRSENNRFIVEIYDKDKENVLEKVEVDFGRVLVTPFCDYSNGKHFSHLSLPLLQLRFIDRPSTKRSEIIKCIKPNYNKIRITNDLFIVYEPRHILTGEKKLELKSNQIFPYYLAKEVVNEIQSQIGASINRVGISSL